MSKQCLTSTVPNVLLVTRIASILEVFTFMNFLRALTKVVKLCFSPNSSVLCSNGGWLAPFCASSFSLDWKAITLMGGRLIWLIPTLEYRPVIGWSISQGSGGTTMHNYKNNRSIIWAQVQPGPCDDKYNALCVNTNTCTTITNATSMTMVLLRLRAFLSDEISLGWKMRRHRLNTDELFSGGRWSLVHLATRIQFKIWPVPSKLSGVFTEMMRMTPLESHEQV